MTACDTPLDLTDNQGLTMSKPHGWGGRRPGAGRKPGVRSPRSKEARQVTLAPGLWERIDTAQAERGLTRTAAFEEMALDWLAKRVARGLTPPREKA